ncbi:glycoside hydrolase family 10 protein [Hortaea werneckii]|nr:glycoside hydrolase family 10 protein [Hortaea werneckii]
MVVRSLVAAGFAASAALASPNPGWRKTVTETCTETLVQTTTETSVQIMTETSTVTQSASCSGSSGSMMTSSGNGSTMSTTMSSSSRTRPSTTLTATATATGSGLNDAAQDAGKLYFGTAADIPGTGEAQDPYYMREFNNTHDFGQATPANIMKFVYTEPEQGVFNFTGGDYFLNITDPTKEYIRCHNLIWGSQLPTWITNPSTNWTNATLSAALHNHVYTTVSYFGDRCYAWDTVNEGLSDSPAGSYMENIWYNVIGPEYIPMAFAAAQQAIEDNDLSVKLYYNDYNIEYLGNKSLAAQDIVSDLKGRGIQIDGVGLESHFIAGSTPSQSAQEDNMRAFVELGVDVAVTELDVRLNLPPNATTEAQQKLDYYNTVAACVAVDGCVAITVWDFVDTYSWIPGTFPGQGYGDLFLQPDGADTPLLKKAAYDGCLEALEGEDYNDPLST